jgi:acyl-CoA thioesterase FadM
MTKVRFWCHFEIKRIEDQKILVECRQQLALVKMPEGKPLRVPDHWGNFVNHE